MNNNLTAINTFNHTCLKRLWRLNISVTAVLHYYHSLAKLMLPRKNFPQANTSSPQSLLIVTTPTSLRWHFTAERKWARCLPCSVGLGTAFLPVTRCHIPRPSAALVSFSTCQAELSSWTSHSLKRSVSGSKTKHFKDQVECPIQGPCPSAQNPSYSSRAHES